MTESARPVRPPQWFPIPAKTREAECRFCGAEIYWITTPAGKKMPVSCDIDGASCPSEKGVGSGVSHFTNCPGADDARKPR